MLSQKGKREGAMDIFLSLYKELLNAFIQNLIL